MTVDWVASTRETCSLIVLEAGDWRATPADWFLAGRAAFSLCAHELSWCAGRGSDTLQRLLRSMIPSRVLFSGPLLTLVAPTLKARGLSI